MGTTYCLTDFYSPNYGVSYSGGGKLRIAPAPEQIYEGETLQTDLLRKKFYEYVHQWRLERGSASSIKDMTDKASYQKIINELGRPVGRPIIQFILEELAREPDFWFAALRELTHGENPVRPDHRGNLQLMTRDWLDWGRSHGYSV